MCYYVNYDYRTFRYYFGNAFVEIVREVLEEKRDRHLLLYSRLVFYVLEIAGNPGFGRRKSKDKDAFSGILVRRRRVEVVGAKRFIFDLSRLLLPPNLPRNE